jgi:hypothetical protein
MLIHGYLGSIDVVSKKNLGSTINFVSETNLAMSTGTNSFKITSDVETHNC